MRGGPISTRSSAATDSLALDGKITEQQDDAVAIAVNRVRAGSAKPGQMIGEVVANDRAQEIR